MYVLLRDRTLFKGNRHHISNLFLSGFVKKKKKRTYMHTHTAQNGGAKRSDVNSNLR